MILSAAAACAGAAKEPRRAKARRRRPGATEAPGGTPGEVVDVVLSFEPGGTLVIPRAFTYVDKSSPPSPHE